MEKIRIRYCNDGTDDVDDDDDDDCVVMIRWLCC
jgi:hypothetical protein